MFALLILLSQKQDPSRNKSYNLIKMCKCVGYFWWIVDELHWMIYLSLYIFFLDMGYIYIFFSSLFFLTCLVDMWHTFFGYASFLFFSLSCLLGMWHTFLGYASFISFCIAHILDDNLGERHDRTWSFSWRYARLQLTKANKIAL